MASTSQTPATYTSQTNWLSSPQQQRVFQQTTVGAVSEIPQSFLVMLTPTLTRELVLNGHTVYFQRGFAQRAGFTDDEYTKAGAQLCHTAEEVYNNSTIILKVNPPQEQEYSYIRPQQVIFCFMNAPVTKEEQQQQQRFLQVLHNLQATLISYSSLQSSTTTSSSSSSSAFTPVHHASTEIMGYLAIQQTMQMMMEKRGVLFGNLTGSTGSNVLIIGCTPCGVRAAMLAAAQGARVTVMDVDMEALSNLNSSISSSNSSSSSGLFNVYTMPYTTTNLENILPTVDVLLCCVIPNTSRAPVLINERQMGLLRDNTIVVDLAACRGGNLSITATNTTTNTTTTTTTTTTTNNMNNTYTWRNNIMVYSPTNITALAPYTTSNTIANAALPFILRVANKGWRCAVLEFEGLQDALFVAAGFFTNNYIASIHNCLYTPVEQVLENDIQQISNQQNNKNNLEQLKQQLNTFRTQQQTNTFTVQA